MTADIGPRYSKAEFARRGTAIYERDIRPHLDAHDDGKFVAIDIETGDFDIDPDDFEATERLVTRRPGSQMWLLRVGYRATYHIWSSSVVEDARDSHTRGGCQPAVTH